MPTNKEHSTRTTANRNQVRVAAIVLLCAAAVPACFQAIDSSISGGPSAISGNSESPDGGSVADKGSTQTMVPLGGGSTASAGNGSSGTASAGNGADAGQCQNGFTIDPATSPIFCTDNTNGGNQPIVTQTPGIELADGATTINPCDSIGVQVAEFCTKYCASCHAHGANPAAPFHTILDYHALPDGGPSPLLAQTAARLTDDAGSPAPLIYPGDPDNSLFYQRVAQRTMPPGASAFGQASSPMPNVSEISLLRSWIESCVGGGGGAAGGGAGGNAGDAGGGGVVDAGGGMDAGRPRGGGADAGRGVRDAGGRG